MDWSDDIMYISKDLRKMIALSVISSSLTFAPCAVNFNFLPLPVVSVAHAEVKTYIGTGEYLMSDGETMDIAKQGAKMHAIRDAQEKAGVFVSSLTEVKNNIVQKDEIETFTVGIVKVGDTKYKPVPLDDDGGYIKFIATVQVTIDTNDLNQKINEWISKKSKERSKSVNDVTSMQKQIDAQAKRIKELEQIITNSNINLDKIKINAELKKIDNETLAIQKFEEGNEFYYKQDYKNAIKLYTEAIQLKPNYADAYNNRGIAYQFGFKDYQKAIEDYTKAIHIDPNDGYAYNNRGLLYQNLGEHVKAIPDFDKAIRCDTNNAIVYYNRGISYHNLKNYTQAISDYNKAIQINPNFANAYNNRGVIYLLFIVDYSKAIVDFTKSIQLNLNSATSYQGRGLAYQALGENAKAQADFAKAKKLGYNG